MIEHDPASTAITAAFTANMNHYVREVLGYKPKLKYNVSAPGDLWKHWEWGSAGAGYPDTSEALRSAMSRNPFMKVFVASGYFDLATPYFATEYTIRHMGLDPAVRQHIAVGYYHSGHMMYVREDDLKKLRADVEKFYVGS